MSDKRVSERTCLSSVTLKPYSVLYNDLNDEVCTPSDLFTAAGFIFPALSLIVTLLHQYFNQPHINCFAHLFSNTVKSQNIIDFIKETRFYKQL